MHTCSVCGNVLEINSKVCSLCGTSRDSDADPEVSLAPDDGSFDESLRWEGLEDDVPATSAAPPAPPQAIIMGPALAGPAEPPLPVVAPPAPASPPRRQCPTCGTVYGPEYGDPYCACGRELVVECSPAAPAETVPAPARPAAESRFLVLYGPDKQPRHRFPLTKDVTLIGRQDPLHGNFPDINLAEWLDGPAARKISRKHALLLHTRATDSFTLRPLAGNTGTQIEQEMVEPLKDYPLRPGTRLILGGIARFKFEQGS
jgi:hypothetical protein